MTVKDKKIVKLASRTGVCAEPRQLTLFDEVQKVHADLKQLADVPEGSLNVDVEFRAALSEDIKECKHSRYQIAARMSELVGESISEPMINNWTAPSEDKRQYRFPARYLSAFVHATGGRRALEVLNKHAGMFAMPGPEALRSEINKIDEEIEKLKSEKSKRKMYLKDCMEGKNG